MHKKYKKINQATEIIIQWWPNIKCTQLL